jgi:TRAP-type mannitol/chloroaromatic compound transport system permease small subunit
MDILHRVIGLCDTLNERVGRLTAWATLAMVVVTFTIVVLRYLFNLGWIAMQESVTYLHAMIFMLGAAYTLKHDGHVRVDIFYQKASARGRAWVDLLGTLLLLLPFCLFLLWVSWDYVAASWALREGSRDSGGLPWLYLLKTLIPAMALLMILQGVAMVLRNLLAVLAVESAGGEHDAPREI